MRIVSHKNYFVFAIGELLRFSTRKEYGVMLKWRRLFIYLSVFGKNYEKEERERLQHENNGKHDWLDPFYEKNPPR